jgi:hypothetical protein
MNTQPVGPDTQVIATSCENRYGSSLCWKAIFGGTVAAIGIHILLTFLGVGAGLATFSPMTDANPVSHFSTGAALVWSLCALVSIFFGAMLAGRFSHSWHAGFVHGILVWSLTLIITLLLLSKGTGMVLGGGLKVLGQGLGIGGQAAASTLGDTTKDGLKRITDEVNSFNEEANATTVRSKRDINFAVAKLFAPENDINSQDNRTAAIKALAASGQLSEADATTMVDNWIASYKSLKAEIDHAKDVAEQKARQTADQAARNLSCASLWSFFALLVGLLVAALGGSCGGKCAMRHAATRTVLTP